MKNISKMHEIYRNIILEAPEVYQISLFWFLFSQPQFIFSEQNDVIILFINSVTFQSLHKKGIKPWKSETHFFNSLAFLRVKILSENSNIFGEIFVLWKLCTENSRLKNLSQKILRMFRTFHTLLIHIFLINLLFTF